MATIVKPKTWNPGEVPSNTDLNSDFDTIYNDYNGNVTDANVASNAAIQPAKILGTAAALQAGSLQVFTAESLASSEGSASLAYTGGTHTSDGTTTNSNGAGSTLKTFNLPASTLTTTGRGVRIKAWGTTTADTNAKTVSLRWGSQTLVTKILDNTATADVIFWIIEATVLRTGLSTQECIAEARQMATSQAHTYTLPVTDTALAYSKITRTAGTQTETGAITVKCVADTATTTGIQQTGFVIEAI